MADGFFHLSFGPAIPSPNAVRLSRALKAARENGADGVYDRMVAEFDRRGSSVREAWLAVHTKFGVLEVVTQRLSRDLGVLLDDLSQHLVEAHACAEATDTAYVTKDTLLPVRLVESVDAFIFQHRSAYEMMGEFVREFCRVILHDPVT